MNNDWMFSLTGSTGGMKDQEISRLCRLLALPSEIRQMIWKDTLMSPGPLVVRFNKENQNTEQCGAEKRLPKVPHTWPDLLLTCREVYTGALEGFYKGSAFGFTSGADFRMSLGQPGLRDDQNGFI